MEVKRMSIGKKGYLYRLVSILIILTIGFLVLYKFGYRIPILNEIPFFSSGHEHKYKPVLSEEGEIEYWTCTMHPSVRLKDPGTCPICGMNLVPVKKKNIMTQTDSYEKSSKEPQEMEGMSGMQGMPGMGDKSRTEEKELKSTFTVSPGRQQIIGVKTEPVTVRPMTKEIRTVGKVELDETKIEHIHTKISGWIDKVFVDYTWKHVKKGNPLFSIYSPELVSTQEEYLLALRSKNILGDSKFPEIASGARSLADATRRRLKLWDITENQIREIERTGTVRKSMIIYSPITGHVTFKNAFENMYVEPNTRIYTIADHTNIWVDADIYENEIPLVKLGQDATVTLNSFPGEVFHGKVIFIWPHLQPETRTTKIRMEFPNPDLKFLPEMYADVELAIPIGEKLTIPKGAVLRTGKQDLVFVDKGGGNMKIRKVELGQMDDEYYEVLRGLQEGENVVSRANFLIDAESKIQAAVATWGEENKVGEEETYEMEFFKEEKDIEGAKPSHIH
jgi:membrane fusion protein, copper/silver efflux system